MSRRLKSLGLAVLGLFAAAAVQAQTSAADTVPTSTLFGFESVRLSQGERMGLASGTLLFDVGGGWGLGPAVYGAASGQRGGLFVFGAEAQHRWALRPGTELAAGLFVGGGGGAAAPVGGGLMLRPALTLLQDFGPSLQAGLAWSSVRFPSGQIRSNQLGVLLAWRGDFGYYGGAQGDPIQAGVRPAGLGFERVAATLATYRLHDGSGRSVELVGARAERGSAFGGLTWGLEAAAAARGGAAGYMEILGTGELSAAPLSEALPGWRLGLRLSGGLGGGGGIATGGGVIGKLSGTTQWTFGRGLTLGAELGQVHGGGTMRAREARLWFATDLEPGASGGNSAARVVRTEWVAALQHQTRAARRDGSSAPLDTMGLKLNRYVANNVYLSGQAHSAYAGGAGAYSVGLIGAGLSTDPGARLRVGAEALIGAAGGGGVATSGGAITQGLAWAAWKATSDSEWRAGAGAVRSLRGGGLSTPVFELSWSHAFGMAGRR